MYTKQFHRFPGLLKLKHLSLHVHNEIHLPNRSPYQLIRYGILPFPPTGKQAGSFLLPGAPQQEFVFRKVPLRKSRGKNPPAFHIRIPSFA